jgi:hypothetical protein
MQAIPYQGALKPYPEKTLDEVASCFFGVFGEMSLISPLEDTNLIFKGGGLQRSETGMGVIASNF